MNRPVRRSEVKFSPFYERQDERGEKMSISVEDDAEQQWNETTNKKTMMVQEQTRRR
jgi:hypothetical protein